MSVELEPMGTLTITMGKKVVFPSSPLGKRLVIDFADVTLEAH
jgi:hypothetical protein